MIELSAIRVDAGHKTILGPVDLSIRPASLTAVIGPNGAGKSTLVKVMSGELAPMEGRVTLDGEPIGDLQPEKLAGRRAVLSQATQLAFPFTVMEVVRLGLAARPGLALGQRTRIALDALRAVDLAGFEARQFASLSGGEQQRAHLARVLCQIGEPVEEGRAKLLILDEPIASLDIRHQVEVLKIARSFASMGGAVVAVLHDINLAAGFADRLVVMENGRIVGDGPPASIIEGDLVPQVFGIAMARAASPSGGLPWLVPDLTA